MAQRDENKDQRQRGWVNYFRVLAGGYLLYLAYRLMRGIWDGSAEQVALNAVAGVVFAVAGAGLLWREWKAYQYAKAHKDDPDTWTLDDGPVADGQTDKNLPEQTDGEQGGKGE